MNKKTQIVLAALGLLLVLHLATNNSSSYQPTTSTSTLETSTTHTPHPRIETVKVNFFGAWENVPVNTDANGRKVTTILTIDIQKLEFMLNAIINVYQFMQVNALFVLCYDCTEEQRDLLETKGFNVFRSHTIADVARFAFRVDGPMSVSTNLAAGDSRRHSPFMFWREWIKFILIENGVSVFQMDIDVCYKRPPPFLMGNFDLVIESEWPNSFRPNSYTFPFLHNDDGSTVDVMINNGHCFTAASPAGRVFMRKFIGWMQAEQYEDTGFPQTGIAKLLHYTHMKLKLLPFGNVTTAIGTDDDGLSVHSFQFNQYGVHPAGHTWPQKKAMLGNNNCWYLPENWQDDWKKPLSIFQLLDLWKLVPNPEGIKWKM